MFDVNLSPTNYEDSYFYSDGQTHLDQTWVTDCCAPGSSLGLGIATIAYRRTSSLRRSLSDLRR